MGAFAQFDDECTYPKGGTKRYDQKLYWEKVAAYPDTGFRCAHDLRQKHTIGGLLFNEAHKVLDHCEFKRMSTDPTGDCGFDAIAMAMTSSGSFVDRCIYLADSCIYKGERRLKNLPTTITTMRKKCADFLAIEADENLLETAIRHWTEYADDIRDGRVADMDFRGNPIGFGKANLRTGRRKKKSAGIGWSSKSVKALESIGQAAQTEAEVFTLEKNYRDLVHALEKCRNDSEQVKRMAIVKIRRCFRWKCFWMDVVVARIIERIYGLKILVVKNFPKDDKDFLPGFAEAKRNDDASKLYGEDAAQNKVQDYWPYVEYVYETESNDKLCVHEHFVVLNNFQNRHFEVFFSNFHRKGIFTYEELCNSPTLSVLFKQVIDHERYARLLQQEQCTQVDEIGKVD